MVCSHVLSGLLTVGVDHGSKWLFPTKSNLVHEVDHGGHDQPGRLTLVEGHAQEGQGGALVHGVVGHVEGEPSDSVVHEDSKVVAQVRAGNAQLVHGTQHKHLACTKEGHAQLLPVLAHDQRACGLFAQCRLVDHVSNDPQRENGGCQHVAALFGPSAHLGERMRVVLDPGHDVPEDRVEHRAHDGQLKLGGLEVHAVDQLLNDLLDGFLHCLLHGKLAVLNCSVGSVVLAECAYVSFTCAPLIKAPYTSLLGEAFDREHRCMCGFAYED